MDLRDVLHNRLLEWKEFHNDHNNYDSPISFNVVRAHAEGDELVTRVIVEGETLIVYVEKTTADVWATCSPFDDSFECQTDKYGQLQNREGSYEYEKEHLFPFGIIEKIASFFVCL